MTAVFRSLLVAVGCLHLLGGPYALVQCVAWSQMLFNYSAESGLIQGAIQTFDGEHPCDLCESIAEAKQTGDGRSEVPPPRPGKELDIKNLFPPPVVNLAGPATGHRQASNFGPPFEGTNSNLDGPVPPPPQFS